VLPVNAFFRRLPPHKKVKNGKTILWGRAVYLSTRWSSKKAKSIFRYGFDELRGIFLNLRKKSDYS